MLNQDRDRSPILVQVEEQGEGLHCLGRARSLGPNGILVETPDTLSEGAVAIIRFFLPPDRSAIETAARVVRSEPGRSMSIVFLGLPDDQKERILFYLKTADHAASPEPVPDLDDAGSRQRRSSRLARRLSVLLNWKDGNGRPHQQAAETLRLSKHGAVVLSFSEIDPGHLVRVWAPDTGNEDAARVVWSTPADLLGKVELGLEFLGADNFWDLPFPEGSSDAPLPASRRSGRLPQQVEVTLCWRDERGRAREELGRTRLLSQHGALLSLPAPLEVGQQIQLKVPSTTREVESEVVWTCPGEIPGRTDLGVTFLGHPDFWGLAFPPPEQHLH